MATILPVALNLSAAASELPAVRVYRSSRRIGVLAASAAGAATVAVLCSASPASAGVTVSPAVAPQGAGANVTFRVVNDHPKAAITRVRLVLPTATPIAEVYPLSVPNWAPQITSRTLNPPMQSIHGGAPVSEATASITWTAAKGKAILPGKAANLMIAIGPLPETERMSFTLLPTYADGSKAPAIPSPVLNLAPAESLGVMPTGHSGAEHGDGTGLPTADETLAAPHDSGPGVVSIIGWLIALLTGAVGVVLITRSRRPGPARTVLAAAAAAGPASTSAKSDRAPVKKSPLTNPQRTKTQRTKTQPDPGTATPRTRVSAWSYRDGP